MEIEVYYQRNTINQVNTFLKSIKDPVKQFSNYLTWCTAGKFLIELRICWDLQRFKDEESWIKLIKISMQLTKKDFKETTREIDEYRKSPNYEEDMRKFGKEIENW